MQKFVLSRPLYNTLETSFWLLRCLCIPTSDIHFELFVYFVAFKRQSATFYQLGLEDQDLNNSYPPSQAFSCVLLVNVNDG